MTKAAIYLLRIKVRGVAYYLNNVSPNGCNVEFDLRIDFGWRFTEKERADLTRDHGHIRGRWVLLDREEKRRAAIQGAEDRGAAIAATTAKESCAKAGAERGEG